MFEFIDTNAKPDPENRRSRIADMVAVGYSTQEPTVMHDAAQEAAVAGIKALQDALAPMADGEIKRGTYYMALKMMHGTAAAKLRMESDKALLHVAAALAAGLGRPRT